MSRPTAAPARGFPVRPEKASDPPHWRAMFRSERGQGTLTSPDREAWDTAEAMGESRAAPAAGGPPLTRTHDANGGAKHSGG